MNEPYQSLRKLLSSVENLDELEDMFRKGFQKKVQFDVFKLLIRLNPNLVFQYSLEIKRSTLKKSWRTKILILMITFIESKVNLFKAEQVFVLFVTNAIQIQKIQFLMTTWKSSKYTKRYVLWAVSTRNVRKVRSWSKVKHSLQAQRWLNLLRDVSKACCLISWTNPIRCLC